MFVSRRSIFLVMLPLLLLAGCTVFPTQKTPSLQATTSAEQTERLLWRAAAKQDLKTVTNLIAAGAVFTMRDGSVLTREQFVERLRASAPADYAIGQVALGPHGNDMVLSYPASVRDTARNVTVGVTVLSVWQQTKSGTWTLVARSETPSAVPSR